jgi:hypothetical protein
MRRETNPCGREPFQRNVQDLGIAELVGQTLAAAIEKDMIQEIIARGLRIQTRLTGFLRQRATKAADALTASAALRGLRLPPQAVPMSR